MWVCLSFHKAHTQTQLLCILVEGKKKEAKGNASNKYNEQLVSEGKKFLVSFFCLRFIRLKVAFFCSSLEPHPLRPLHHHFINLIFSSNLCKFFMLLLVCEVAFVSFHQISQPHFIAKSVFPPFANRHNHQAL